MRDPKQRPPRVLVVDDHDPFRSYLVELLISLGYDPSSAKTAEKALQLVDGSGDFDIVLTEVVLPGIDGVELARRVRAEHPDTPVLLMTGPSRYVDSAIEAGTIPLLKPFPLDTLQRVLNEKLNGAATRP
jgi:CheY-like chemotaxis protein